MHAILGRDGLGGTTARRAGGGLVPRAREGLRGAQGGLIAGMALAGLVAALMFAAMHEAMTDDAYILLVYARNLATGLHWGLLPDQVSNMATSPGYVLLLGASSFVLGSPVLAVGAIYMAQSALLVLALDRLGRTTGLGSPLAWVGTPLLLLNPMVASSLGLETTFSIVLLVCLTWAATTGSARGFGLVSGAVIVTRLDLVVLVLVLAVSRAVLLRRCHVAVAWASAVALPWFAFSWVALGSAVPDTLVFKQQQVWGRFVLGLYDLWLNFPWQVGSSIVVPALGIVAALTWPWWRRAAGLRDTGPLAALGLAGVVYFVVYVGLGVPPYFWYFDPSIATLTVTAAAGLCALGAKVRRGRAAVAAPAVLVLVAPMLVAWGGTAQERLPLDRMPVHANWATPVQYAEIGQELGRRVGERGVRSHGETGVLLFFCECRLVDNFTDRGRITDVIEDATRDNRLLRLNYAFFDADEYAVDSFRFRIGRRPGRDPRPLGWDMDNPDGEREHLVLVRRGTREPVRFPGIAPD